jgi:hypothetical protein
LCLGHQPFFRAWGTDVTLRCYELAKFYGTDPDVFLCKPISKITRAVDRTEKLIESAKKAAKD